MKKRNLLILFALLFCLTGSALADYPKYYGQHGTAKYIAGRTLIVEIYADDATTTWDTLSRADFQTALVDYRNGMSIGLSWLEKQVARYGQTAEFLLDARNVQTDHYTSFFASFSSDLMSHSDEGYREISRFITQNVDTEDLMDYFDADNIIYAVFLNAPSNNNYVSYAYPANSYDLAPNQFGYEIAVFMPYGQGRRNTPAVYAHEILHMFGAADLYKANDFVPQKYVDYLNNNKIKDLMNNCYFSDYDKVTTPFSDVDAYFVGLIPTCNEVQRFGLGPSVYERYQ